MSTHWGQDSGHLDAAPLSILTLGWQKLLPQAQEFPRCLGTRQGCHLTLEAAPSDLASITPASKGSGLALQPGSKDGLDPLPEDDLDLCLLRKWDFETLPLCGKGSFT